MNVLVMFWLLFLKYLEATLNDNFGFIRLVSCPVTCSCPKAAYGTLLFSGLYLKHLEIKISFYFLKRTIEFSYKSKLTSLFFNIHIFTTKPQKRITEAHIWTPGSEGQQISP